MKFEFQSTNKDGDVVSHKFEELTWYGALSHFVKFLRGSGYTLQDHSVGINEAAGHVFIRDDDAYSNITFFDQEKE